ncbi:transposase family protein [Streptomyces sp. NPDC051956]|uniref:transposase family protein n=1 Tax=Streptomyces sp. NPDC051956 TaxID=3365677 RepID=UPI0037CF62EA
MKLTWARAACSHPALSGVSRAHFGELFAELAAPWQATRQSGLGEARGRERRRAAGAGRKPKLVFCDRLLLALVHLRHQLPHEVLAEMYGVDRSTVSTAIRQVRPLLAARGFAVPDRPGARLRTLEDVFAYAEAEDVELRLDGAETQVRRPRAGRPGRRAFVSGKRRQNTIKTTTFGDGQGRMLLSEVVRPGRMHDQTALRTEGFAEQLRGRGQTVDVAASVAAAMPDILNTRGLSVLQQAADAALYDGKHSGHAVLADARHARHPSINGRRAGRPGPEIWGQAA